MMPDDESRCHVDDLTSTYPGMPVGTPVYTADGDKLGTVKQIQGVSFKVDAPMRPDYWLRTALIATVGADRVELAVPKDQLGDYQLDEPADA
jgi:hypothetical protein